MVNRQGSAQSVCRRVGWNLLASAAIIALAAGCTKLGKKNAPQSSIAAINYSKQAQRPPLQPNNPLHIKTTKWARKHQKKPSDAGIAVNYARSLKAIGAKQKAFEVAARTYQLNPGNAELTSEYGRLALDLGKVQLADQLLNKAIRGSRNPDWRLLSALGTVQAKRGNHKKAQSFYVAALKRQPGATSVYNNLALSYALDGKAGSAEKLLKEAVNKGHNTQVVRQNLALVLGIQSKFEEAQQVAQVDLDNNRIDNNVSFLRKMVKATKVASAQKSQPSLTAKADTKTTAALPRKRTAASNPVAKAPKQTTAEQKPGIKAPVPGRKPAPSARIATEIARTLTKEQKQEMARELPWRKQPTAAKARKTAVANPPKTAPAAGMKKAPSWSVKVSEPAETKPAEQPAKKERTAFRFPTAD